MQLGRQKNAVYHKTNCIKTQLPVPFPLPFSKANHGLRACLEPVRSRQRLHGMENYHETTDEDCWLFNPCGEG